MSAGDAPLATLPGVGPKLSEKLERLGLQRVEDLLFHLPLRYEDRTRIHPIGGLQPGQRALIEGEIEHSGITGGRRSLAAVLADGTGRVTLRLFRFYPNQQRQLRRGARVRCYGEVRPGYRGLEMIHPEIRACRPGDAVEEALTPVYPTTEGLGQASLRRLIDQALNRLEPEEWLPGKVPGRPAAPTMAECLQYVHRPPPDADLQALAEGRHPCQRRLAFEELVAHRLSLRVLRARIRQRPSPALVGDDGLVDRFQAQLAFELTPAQKRVVEEIGADLSRPRPTLRLVQGDVGSGKTVVAARALLQAVAAGYQAALTAPTELLAEQHFRTLSAWFEPLGVQLAWLSGKVRGKQRKDALAQIAGEAQVVVGTHALMQEGVSFRDLALVVIDEQHRFGVHQRLALRDKGAGPDQVPHQLIMTATPIPRTLAMTAFADLDVSVIDELPPGRTPVATVAASNARRDEVIQRVASACTEGRQVYWVCTLIEESDALEAEAAEATAQRLAASLPAVRVELIHCRLKPAEKDAIMLRFAAGEVDLLVATTVIEVGVDVPNASLMIIENAERLGLSQLHQLRGRVGRGSTESTCVLLYQPPLSAMARERLALMRETTDGFAIAQRDLELRGPGEVLGTRQTGSIQFRIADLARDRAMLEGVSDAADHLLSDHPETVEPLIQRWVGAADHYALV